MPLELAAEWLRWESALGFRPTLRGENVEQMRNVTTPTTPSPKQSHDVDVKDVTISGPHPITVRVYTPTKARDYAHVALFFHGGGWCIGDLDQEDDFVRYMAVQGRLLFVSVDYRLAPEDPWPASLEDCVAAAKWALQETNLGMAGSQPRGVILCGTSAGGQLALSTAAELLKEHLPVQGVLSLAPFTVGEEAVPEHLKAGFTSQSENANSPIVDLKSLNILLGASGAPLKDPAFSVLLSPVLPRFPATYLVTSGADILRDHGVLMEQELKRHGVRVKRDHYVGYPHMFWTVRNLEATSVFFSNLLQGLDFAVGRSTES